MKKWKSISLKAKWEALQLLSVIPDGSTASPTTKPKIDSNHNFTSVATLFAVPRTSIYHWQRQAILTMKDSVTAKKTTLRLSEYRLLKILLSQTLRLIESLNGISPIK